MGYSSSNFATAFKKQLNVSPVDFRKVSEQMVEESSFSHGVSIDELEATENLITVEQLESFLVVYERKKGNYNNMPEEWCKFIHKYEYLATEDTIYIESTIDDPSITDENSCMYELCQTISPNLPILKGNNKILTHTFDGGKYAVYHFKGFPQFLFMIYQEIFCRWLSKTCNQLDNRPIFDIYRNVREDGYMDMAHNLFINSFIFSSICLATKINASSSFPVGSSSSQLSSKFLPINGQLTLHPIEIA